MDYEWEAEAPQIESLLGDLLMKVPSTPLVEHRLNGADVPLPPSVLWSIQCTKARRAAALLSVFVARWCLLWADWLLRGWRLWITLLLLAGGAARYCRLEALHRIRAKLSLVAAGSFAATDLSVS